MECSCHYGILFREYRYAVFLSQLRVPFMFVTTRCATFGEMRNFFFCDVWISVNTLIRK